MTFDVSRVSDPLFVSENRVPAHSGHRWFASAAEAANSESSFERSLNGMWKFHYAPIFDESPTGFESPDFDVSLWHEIPVPAHIQLQGFDSPQYVNVQYPWDGREQIMPGQIPTEFNPVASYRTEFELETAPADGERISIVFHGAESAIALWVNGTYIGYATDSFTPSEFDLTDVVVAGTNVLAAQVFKWTSQSWLEDQDFFRFSGIFRDVVLLRKPKVHVADLTVKSVLSNDFAAADIVVDAVIEGEGSVRISLSDGTVLEPNAAGQFVTTLHNPRLWSAEDPALYQLLVEVLDSDGAVTEVIPQAVGVRRFALEDGLFKINGQRLVFKGVNRHDFGLNGRVVTPAEAEHDIITIKRMGLNSVRTSHYPNNSFFYDLCDLHGLYVIDEMNLETHGLWDRLKYGGAPDSEAVPGDKPEWRPALMERAANLVQRDKNHPSIIMWSVGNESYGGTNILAVADYFREVDDRPVHYEGTAWDPRYPETTDVYSEMYTPAAKVEEYLKTNREKPMILCEFAHAMGNSFGAVHKYVELAYREPLYQGGFIWDFADQAIAMTDRYGKKFMGYGGDNLEAPHDSDFCGNGILFADHTPKPFAQEVQHVYRGIVTMFDGTTINVENRLLFTNTSSFDLRVTLKREGTELGSAVVATDVAPLTTGQVDLPFALPTEPGEYTITASWQLCEATSWADAGHEIAWDQTIHVVEGAEPPAASAAPTVVYGIHNIGVKGENFSVLFSRLAAGLQSYRFGGHTAEFELLRGVPSINFWHAPTSNERAWKSGYEDGQWLLASRYAVSAAGADQPAVEELADRIRVTYTHSLPTVPVSNSALTYDVFADGTVTVTLDVNPGEGVPEMPEMGMLFEFDAELNNLKWYGNGPQENYVDRKLGARLDVYEAGVSTQLTQYLRPQEAGNHTGVRWAQVTDNDGRGVKFSHDQEMEFSALPWTPFEIENASHHTDLPPVRKTVLSPALMRRGVAGDDTWGAQTHPEYRLPVGKALSFTFSFQGV